MCQSTITDDYVSILVEVRRRGRALAPMIRGDLASLLGGDAPSGLSELSSAAEAGRLTRGNARARLTELVGACSRAIDAGSWTEMERYEVGYSEGSADYDYREVQALSDTARRLLPIRRDLAAVLDLLQRGDDLIAARREAARALDRFGAASQNRLADPGGSAHARR